MNTKDFSVEKIAEYSMAFSVKEKQKEEIEKRLKAYEIDKNRGKPVKDVISEIRDSL